MRNLLGIWILFIAVFAAGCAKPQANAEPAREITPTTARAKIDSFQGRYRFLSNFYPATVIFEGVAYPTVEHAYQAAKSLDINERKRIASLPEPGEAKRAGQALVPRADWETVKFDAMEKCVRDKFTRHPELAAMLIETGDAYLEEGNTWRDTIWGVYQGHGDNRLGKILMKIRTELLLAPAVNWAKPGPLGRGTGA